MLTMHILQHLTLAAAAGSFMQDRQCIVIWGHDLNS